MSITIHTRFTPSDAKAFKVLMRAVEQQCQHPYPQAPVFTNEVTPTLAYRGDKLAAHAVARLQTGSSTIGTIGCFHAQEDPEAVAMLLGDLVRRLRAQGAERILGPMDGDTWHAYRVNSGPYASPPFVKEPWNPPYYDALWQASGFHVAERYDSFVIDAPAAAGKRLSRFHQRSCRNDITFTPITARNYEVLLPQVYDISRRIFADNVLYTPVQQEEFIRMYKPASRLLLPGLSWLAHDRDQQPVGYVFTYPDVAKALHAMRDRPAPLAALFYLLKRRKATRSCIKTLGVVPEHRGSGLTAALMHLAFANSAKLGFQETLMCLMHSANDSRRFSGGLDRPFRNYTLYEADQ